MANDQLLHGETDGNDSLDEEQLLHDALNAGKYDPAAHVAGHIKRLGVSLTEFSTLTGVGLDALVNLLQRKSCSTATWDAIERSMRQGSSRPHENEAAEPAAVDAEGCLEGLQTAVALIEGSLALLKAEAVAGLEPAEVGLRRALDSLQGPLGHLTAEAAA